LDLAIYRKLLLIRRCQEAIIAEYPKDEIKTPVHLDVGMEGISVGVTHGLPTGSKVFGYYRGHGLYLAMTGETDRYFAELYGRSNGTGGGRGGSMHLMAPERGLMLSSGIVGATVSAATGAALAHQYQGSGAVVVSVFGDAVPECGEFWESLNFACLHGLRIIFVCADNGLAAQVPQSQRRGFGSLQEAVGGFECAAPTSIDGSDTNAVLAAVAQAIRHTQEHSTPVVLTCCYFRYYEHVGTYEDWHTGYRSKPANWEALDPVARYEQHLLDEGVTPEGLAAVDGEVREQVAQSLRRARRGLFPADDSLIDGVYV
jgi:acetoin:2,6-dichlorophenolindophenol oxidoreductase subunit alpha